MTIQGISWAMLQETTIINISHIGSKITISIDGGVSDDNSGSVSVVIGDVQGVIRNSVHVDRMCTECEDGELLTMKKLKTDC
jgi:hypothetical protein